MKKVIYHLILISLCICVSCNKGKINKSLLPTITGNAGELILVLEKNYWKGIIGDTLRGILHQDVPGLPQSEPMFDIAQIPSEAFTDIFKKHRNIVYCRIGNNYQEKFEFGQDQWATPQLFIQISAPDEQSFVNLVAKNSDNLIGLLLKAENDRLISNYSEYQDIQVMKKLEDFCGVKMIIPKGYNYDLDTNNFVWISHETPEISQGIFVYFYDYKDTADFSLVRLLDKRNEMLKNYVAGPRPGSYMTSELQLDPILRSYYISGQYSAEVRGLWKVEGDYMGGPFVSVSRIDKKYNRIVTADAYVYAPKYDKRNYMRQLEAIINTLQFSE
jgi:hypothetical protein